MKNKALALTLYESNKNTQLQKHIKFHRSTFLKYKIYSEDQVILRDHTHFFAAHPPNHFQRKDVHKFYVENCHFYWYFLFFRIRSIFSWSISDLFTFTLNFNSFHLRQKQIWSEAKKRKGNSEHPSCFMFTPCVIWSGNVNCAKEHQSRQIIVLFISIVMLVKRSVFHFPFTFWGSEKKREVKKWWYPPAAISLR